MEEDLALMVCPYPDECRLHGALLGWGPTEKLTAGEFDLFLSQAFYHLRVFHDKKPH